MTDKVIALMWALYVIVRPRLDLFEFIRRRTVSITTDMGTEIALCDCPDITTAFIQWCSGSTLAEVKYMVNFGAKLLRLAIRIDGYKTIE